MKQQEVTASLGPKLFGIPGLLAFASNPPSLGQSPTEKPVQFVLQTSQPYDVLQIGRGADAGLRRGRTRSSSTSTAT